MTKNIIDTVRQENTLTTLVAAIDHTGLADTLGDGLFTVFAPSDEAFAELPSGTVASLLREPETLIEILTYHLVPGRLTASEAAERRRVQTIQGEELFVSSGNLLHVDGACVTSADVETSNGLIHVIDRVLLPAQI